MHIVCAVPDANADGGLAELILPTNGLNGGRTHKMFQIDHTTRVNHALVIVPFSTQTSNLPENPSRQLVFNSTSNRVTHKQIA